MDVCKFKICPEKEKKSPYSAGLIMGKTCMVIPFGFACNIHSADNSYCRHSNMFSSSLATWYTACYKYICNQLKLQVVQYCPSRVRSNRSEWALNYHVHWSRLSQGSIDRFNWKCWGQFRIDSSNIYSSSVATTCNMPEGQLHYGQISYPKSLSGLFSNPKASTS